MKKKLQAELKELANKILHSENENSISSLKLQVRDLYEKITVLAFTEENLISFSPEIAAEVKEPVAAKTEVAREVVQKEEPQPAQPPKFVPHIIEEKDDYLPDGTEFNDSEAITEPNTEKIKDIVAHMPPETQNLDQMINKIISKNGVEKFVEPPVEKKKDFRDLGVDYDNLPSFEPVKKQDKEQRPRSLNDRLKNGINIGLNERLAFIRHLFDGKTADYNRVISQLNTFDSVTEAKKFIQMVVKPDYKNWAGKEEYEQKFLDLVENKFKH
ncbi:hypothetical protein FK178_12035 [Antarcticibacterium arcticum]|uniref:Uncharacterized protein n=1 Tax=Antarcticibacterium arcticum TaxID=2585771 RepID=A0A5B8YMB4_9FLAO|nr:hypothetical protein [Antarcticibacterium arcticum]QED38398.1 hypothetical protein FK178_12035 [Antarcticibacterium arcticum]